MQTIADCKEREKQAWAMLTTYLATGRTVVRLRLEDEDLQPENRRSNISTETTSR